MDDLTRAALGGDPVALTAAMIRIPSVNPTLEPGGAGEADVGAAVVEWLEGWGFSPRVESTGEGRCNVRATLSGDPDAPTLLLNGHLDTVGVLGMSIPPFEPEIRDGRLHGRGACDMKSGNAVILAVAHRLAQDPPRGTLEILFTADEEHASIGMMTAVEAGIEADFAVVTEPTGLAVMPAHKGFAWVRADFDGRAAHGSRPDVGIDAIRSSGRLLAALDDLEASIRDRAPHPLLGHGSVHAGTIEGGDAPSIYPDRCTLRLERRTLPDEAPEAFEDEVRVLADQLAATHSDFRVRLETELVRAGSDVPSDHPGVLSLLEALESHRLPRKLEGMTAWVDAAFLNAAGIPAICFGPGSIERAHSAVEWVPVREIELGADVLSRFARSYLE